MKWKFGTGLFVCLAVLSSARAGEPESGNAQPTPPASAPPAQKAKSETNADDQTKVLAELVREIKSLKDQYAKDKEQHTKEVEQQRQLINAQQKQIEALQKTDQRPEQADKAAAERQQKLAEVQQKQLKLLEEQTALVAGEVQRLGPALDKLQGQAATLESQSKQGAVRDQEENDAIDTLRDQVDNLRRNPPPLPSTLRELFLPSGTNATPFSMFNSISTNYHIYPSQKGAGHWEFEGYQPFFLVQLNKRFLFSGELSVSPGGASLSQAQIDMFINDWLTADIGYFIAPTGFMNERLDPVWIIKTPDLPLSMLQVIPDGLTIMGLQFRGAKYLFGSPVKVEYSTWATNGLGVPGAGQAADWADLSGVAGTSGNVNNAMAYGGRLGLWIPSRGINFGVSEFVNAPFGSQQGAIMSIWQPYFNYHRGNWDFRFEYGNNWERTKPFIGNNIHREGLYAQIAYRNYASLHKHLQRLEPVFRFSDARFQGINQKAAFANPLDPLQATPVNANQYLVGMNYYFTPSTVMKVAYEFNQALKQSLRDNIFMVQFATNF
jgi:hypothetical protein